MTPQNTSLLSVSVRTREKVLFEGSARSVTSFNLRGRFDILPFHTNFITLISRYIIINMDSGEARQFDIDKGILYVMTNKVSVYVGI